jgi:hypothetical protein
VAKANKKHSDGKKKSAKEASKKVSKAKRKQAASKKKSEKAVGNKSKKNGKKSANKKEAKKKSTKSKKDRKKKSKKSNRKQTGKVGKKKPAKSNDKVRQSSANCGVADVLAAVKKFTAYTANLNQNKRITRFVSQGQSKASKALTAFESAHSLLGGATANGTLCNNKAANSTVSIIYRTLQNCSKSAASLCSVELSSAENATVNSCLGSLEAFVASFQVHAHTFYFVFYSHIHS